MPLNLTNIDTLKHQLATAPVLEKVYKYFLDHFGENEEFFNLGARADDEVLAAFVKAVAQQLYGPKAKVTDWLLVRLAEHHFIHGTCRIEGRPVNVLWFDDIQVGMIALPGMRPNEKTRFSRFTGRRMPGGFSPSAN
ncbi:MAG TPA: hypothetical protein VFE47_03460 [Tepidisphaeraceae bacterium]|jgi:hypothetical protein|nr:hypothetical protein [Tepidisphaeraceae bacterium]